MKVNELESRSN